MDTVEKIWIFTSRIKENEKLILWEKRIVIAILFLYTGAFFSLTSVIDWFTPVYSVIWYLVYIIIFLLFLLYFEEIAITRKDHLILLVVVLCCASVLWSDHWIITFKNSLQLLIATIFAIYLTVRFNMKEILYYIALAIGIAIALSFLAGLFFPSYGIHHDLHEGSWKGIFTHKNYLGRLMVLGSIVYVLLALSSNQNRRFHFVGFAYSFILLLLSTSQTALAVFLALFLLLPFFRLLRLERKWLERLLIFVIIIFVVFVVLFLVNFEFVVSLFGRDITLTGRTILWQESWNKFLEHPLLGYGYSAFWLGMDGPSAEVWKAVHWDPPHAHNGWIDLCLDLGVLGLIVFAVGFFRNLYRGVKFLRSRNQGEAAWPFVYLIFLALYNFTESTIIAKNAMVFWLIYVAAIFSMLKEMSAPKMKQVERRIPAINKSSV